MFYLTKFPFDEQECEFVLNIHDKIRLSEDEPAVVYNGPKKVNEFEITDISSWTTYALIERSTNGYLMRPSGERAKGRPRRKGMDPRSS